MKIVILLRMVDVTVDAWVDGYLIIEMNIRRKIMSKREMETINRITEKIKEKETKATK